MTPAGRRLTEEIQSVGKLREVLLRASAVQRPAALFFNPDHPLVCILFQLFSHRRLIKSNGVVKGPEISVNGFNDLTERHFYFGRKENIKQDKMKRDIPIRKTPGFPRLIEGVTPRHTAVNRQEDIFALGVMTNRI